MPVEFARKDGTRRIRFKTGVAYEGTDYEAGQEAEVSERWAHTFIAQGRAEEVREVAREKSKRG